MAFKVQGPRGQEGDRPDNINDVGNLMLLCPTCHKLIDDHPTDYNRQTLEEYKSRHERRIHHVTGLGPDQETSILVLKTKIGAETVNTPFDQIMEAISPRYPLSRHGTLIDLTQIQDNGRAFLAAARETIQYKIGHMFDAGGEVEQAGHVSVFALAPIPLLIVLGKSLSNKVPADLYQRHRSPENWTWRKGGKTAEYTFRRRKKGEANKVALLLSLSGTIPLTAIPDALHRHSTIYEITLGNKTPATTYLRKRKELDGFRTVYQEALGRIVKTHGLLPNIDLFPAVPAPVAVLCGRELLAKVHPRLRVHDYNKNTGGFTFTLTV